MLNGMRSKIVGTGKSELKNVHVSVVPGCDMYEDC